MVSWDPSTYQRFAAERSRPFDDLVRRIATDAPRQVVDLGCGAGDLTASLARRWPAAHVLGVDSSSDMLARADDETSASDLGGRLSFVQADIATWTPDPAPGSVDAVDVIITNAALQWVPGHLELLPRWVDLLAPGGWLALQVPGNFAAPSHAVMRQVAAEEPFAERLAGVLRGTESVAQPTTYATLLADLGGTVDAWETTYVQVLDVAGQFADDAVLAWVSGTGLRPVMDALADDTGLRQAFVDTYAERLRAAYPRRSWGTLLPFRRVFCVARKGAAA
jgi:trans-aconitate 2-methyltransferase